MSRARTSAVAGRECGELQHVLDADHEAAAQQQVLELGGPRHRTVIHLGLPVHPVLGPLQAQRAREVVVVHQDLVRSLGLRVLGPPGHDGRQRLGAKQYIMWLLHV